MRTSVVVLTKTGLSQAHRLVEGLAGEVRVFGPSCVVGPCGGPANGITTGPPEPFPTSDPTVFGWVGSLAKQFPAIARGADALIAVMPVANLARLFLRTTDRLQSGAIIVAVDDPGDFAICVSKSGEGARGLTYRVAEILGATPLLTFPVESPAEPSARAGDRTLRAGRAGRGS